MDGVRFTDPVVKPIPVAILDDDALPFPPYVSLPGGGRLVIPVRQAGETDPIVVFFGLFGVVVTPDGCSLVISRAMRQQLEQAEPTADRWLHLWSEPRTEAEYDAQAPAADRLLAASLLIYPKGEAV